MSKTEIIRQLPQLTAQERDEIRARLNELDGITSNDWDDDGELTDAEKQLIEERAADAVKNPGTSIPWPKAEETLKARWRT